MALVGLVFFLIGLGLMYFSRRTHGISGAVLFVLGLLVFGFGFYALFIEQGEGLGRWVEWLR